MWKSNRKLHLANQIVPSVGACDSWKYWKYGLHVTPISAAELLVNQWNCNVQKSNVLFWYSTLEIDGY